MRDFADQIADILDRWEDEFTTTEERLRQGVALETAERLRQTSPKRPHGGEYAAGWEAEAQADGSVVVYNKAKPSLTHLLENGHANPTAIRGKKRTPAKKHIGKANDWAVEQIKRRYNEL